MTEEPHHADRSAADEQDEIDAEVEASRRALRHAGDEREAALWHREHDADQRDEAAGRRDEQAAKRRTSLDDRQWMLDERVRSLDRREARLDERDRVADQHEIDRELVGWNDTDAGDGT